MSEAEETTPIPEAWIGKTVELIFISGNSTEYADGASRRSTTGASS